MVREGAPPCRAEDGSAEAGSVEILFWTPLPANPAAPRAGREIAIYSVNGGGWGSSDLSLVGALLLI